MLKLVRHLKPFILSLSLIITLLFLQANADLALPDYMSKIVNVGIQQGGIENAVPKVIRTSEVEKLKLFMNENEKKVFDENYLLLDKQSLSAEGFLQYLDNYPQLEKETLYLLNTDDKQKHEELNQLLGKQIFIVSGLEKEGTDPFTGISSLPTEKVEEIKSEIEEKMMELPESMITQSAVLYLKNEYSAIGIDTEKMQLNYVLYAGLQMILIALASMFATVFVGLLAAKVAAGLGRNLRKDVFEKVTNFSNTELDKFSTASLITRSTNDIQQVQMMFVCLLRIVFYAPIVGIGGIIKALQTDINMGWVISVAVMAILTLMVVMFAMAIPKFKLIQKLIDKLNLVTRESLIGILDIRAFNTQKYEEEKFELANQNLTKTNLFVNRVMVMMMPLMMLIMNLVMILIVWVGSHQVDAGVMQVGDMMAFIQYTMQIIMAFLMISFVSIMIPRASVSAQRIYEVIDTEIMIKDPQISEHFHKGTKGLIEFKNVSFRYPGAEEDVLSDVSFTAKPGQTTAIIGSTGSGKSTLVNLIPRFYDVTAGEIIIDGVDIRKVSQQELRKKIGFVPQKGVLFSGTIESNLKFGKMNADEKDLIKSSEIAQAIEFIREKPQGFQTEISQGGTNISGGQKQRLSIARALIKKPEIFIFDDSFSALDFKTDAALRKALKNETKESTILIVAQRINTIMNADQIIVLDEGKIVGIGTHQELMKTNEVYQQIALSQLPKEGLI